MYTQLEARKLMKHILASRKMLSESFGMTPEQIQTGITQALADIEAHTIHESSESTAVRCTAVATLCEDTAMDAPCDTYDDVYNVFASRHECRHCSQSERSHEALRVLREAGDTLRLAAQTITELETALAGEI